MVWLVDLLSLLLRPSGRTSSIEAPVLNKRFYVVQYPTGQPDKARFITTAQSKEDLFTSFFHYSVSKPSKLKRCASCRQFLSELCIQTEVLCILISERFR
jgi:hypothetical protein